MKFRLQTDSTNNGREQRVAFKHYENTTAQIKKLLGNIQVQIQELTTMILDQLSKSQRNALNSLIISRVHHRDVLRNMGDKVDQATDFLFRVHIKFFIQENESIPGHKLGSRINAYTDSIEQERCSFIMKEKLAISQKPKDRNEEEEKKKKKKPGIMINDNHKKP